MAAHRTVPPGNHVPTADQRLVIYSVPFEHYEAQLALRGDRSAPRIAFLDGTMELMRPAKDHERIKSYIGRLIEAYAIDRGIDLSPYGAWTLKNTPKHGGLEPDECYLVGDQNKDTPDLAVEVIWTSGGIDKLEIYRRLGVREVWIWRDSQIAVHVLREQRYQLMERSALFPERDVLLLASFLDRPTALQAVNAFRQALRG
jgi:Uma2 family endonuclease